MADDTTPPTTKACTKCGEAKVLAEYGHDARASDGRQSACRECARGDARARYAAKRAAWLAEHPKAEEVERECSRCGDVKPMADFSGGRRCGACKADEYRAWADRNAGARADYMRAWREENRDHVSATTAAWRAANPEKVSLGWSLRRARRASAPVVERIYRAKVWKRDGGRCHICGKKADPKDWHLDHIVPLSRGGEHSYRNVAVSHPACNQSKWASGPGQMRLLS